MTDSDKMDQGNPEPAGVPKSKKRFSFKAKEGSETRNGIEVLPIPLTSSAKEKQRTVTSSSTPRRESLAKKTSLSTVEGLQKKLLEKQRRGVDEHCSFADAMVASRATANQKIVELINIEKRWLHTGQKAPFLTDSAFFQETPDCGLFPTNCVGSSWSECKAHFKQSICSIFRNLVWMLSTVIALADIAAPTNEPEI